MREGIDCKGKKWKENSNINPKYDLTNQVFSNLKVLFRVENDKSGNAYWLTQCKCGNYLVARATSLRSGHTKSCGCASNDFRSEILTKPLKEGTQFGYWTVLGQAYTPNKPGSFWKVQCKCGTIKEVSRQSLVSGASQSCGCLQKELTSELTKSNLLNQQFGYLTVIAEVPERKNGEVYWLCKCKCGKTLPISGHSLRQKRTVSCGCMKMSIGEYNIETTLKNNHIKYAREFSFKDLVSSKNKPLRYDFAILDDKGVVKRLIEFDGQQHNQAVSYFGGEKQLLKTKNHDYLKNCYAKYRNIPLVRIPYTERDNISLDILLGDKYLIN